MQIGHANFAEKRCSAFAASCVVHLDGDRAAVADAQRRLVRFGEPLLHVGAHAQPVDDDLDRVLGVLREARHGVDLVHRAVDADADEALRAQLDEELELLALAVDDDRRDDHQLRVLVAGARSASVASTICEIVIAASFCSGWSGQ